MRFSGPPPCRGAAQDSFLSYLSIIHFLHIEASSSLNLGQTAQSSIAILLRSQIAIDGSIPAQPRPQDNKGFSSQPQMVRKIPDPYSFLIEHVTKLPVIAGARTRSSGLRLRFRALMSSSVRRITIQARLVVRFRSLPCWQFSRAASAHTKSC